MKSIFLPPPLRVGDQKNICHIFLVASAIITYVTLKLLPGEGYIYYYNNIATECADYLMGLLVTSSCLLKFFINLKPPTFRVSQYKEERNSCNLLKLFFVLLAIYIISFVKFFIGFQDWGQDGSGDPASRSSYIFSRLSEI